MVTRSIIAIKYEWPSFDAFIYKFYLKIREIHSLLLHSEILKFIFKICICQRKLRRWIWLVWKHTSLEKFGKKTKFEDILNTIDLRTNKSSSLLKLIFMDASQRFIDEDILTLHTQHHPFYLRFYIRKRVSTIGATYFE